jgi:hypothetical protein
MTTKTVSGRNSHEIPVIRFLLSAITDQESIRNCTRIYPLRQMTSHAYIFIKSKDVR